jgi:hypothetical protein
MSFRSAVHEGGNKFRPLGFAPFEISATIDIPAGRILGTSDRLRFFALGANTQIIELTITTNELDTGTNTLTLNAGFESHNTGVTASNLTAYASASTVGQAGGTARFEPTTAAPAAAYTVTVSPQAAANAMATAGRITVHAVAVAASLPVGLLGSGLGNAYDHGRTNPTV